ncbi:XdhC family protein [Algibacter sp. Ld11]|uniref:XdhC family protein n=1 Tax=Algibacter sp. Ld11 TaxID=649150 RepID=UPI003865F529
MTHEFIDIVHQAIELEKQHLKSVLASVVALDGSSYRRPGVRMLIDEHGNMTGAVSGGCVEKEILRQSALVFQTGQSKMMTYDGRYRLGCEGVLYILIEPILFSSTFVERFFECVEQRDSFEIQSFYNKSEGIFTGVGSLVKFESREVFAIHKDFEYVTNSESLTIFSQSMTPRFKLLIIGGEHDAVQLCKYAAFTGWDVEIISGISDSRSLSNFPGAKMFKAVSLEDMDVARIDQQTAVVLMTHNFASDLRYLVALQATNPAYIGLLGPSRRREDLLNQFVEYCSDVSEVFLDCIHGPAGLDIGAETPQEIAVSIISEILAIVRNKNPKSLSRKSGRIHAEE